MGRHRSSSRPLTDIVCIADKGGDPEIVRESQRRRFADVGLVDRVLELDAAWREGEGSGAACRAVAALTAIARNHLSAV